MENVCRKLQGEKYRNLYKFPVEQSLFLMFQESFPDLAVSKHFGDKLNKSDKVMIPILNPDFNLEDVDPELIIDVIILKIFDSLTSYEQLMLKCSSILGDIFPRDMLLYIMSTSAMRLTAIGKESLRH